MSVLAAKNLSTSFGDTPVLRDVTFAVAAKEVIGLIGPNGAGKTTLLRCLAGLLAPDAGEILFADKSLEKTDRTERARCIGFLPQSGESHWPVGVETLVELGRLPWRDRGAAEIEAGRQAVEEAMRTCDVLHLRERVISELSGGERARVLLARVLAGTPEILLADEPVAGLDPSHQLSVMNTLKEMAAAGAGVVTVLHDLSLAARFCDRLVLLYDGTIRAEGDAATVLSPENLAACYGIEAKQGSMDGIPYILPAGRL